jgi:malonate transporter and related proteins
MKASISDVDVSRSGGGFWRMARTITNINQPAKRLNLPAVNYLQLILPDFSLIICGYLICRYTKLDRTVWGQVDSLVYFFLFPVLLFQSITRYPLALDAASQFMMAGVSLAICGIALAYSVPYWPFVKKYIDPRDHAGSAQIGFRFNSFIALAVSQKLLGDNGLAYTAILIGVSVPIFNIAAVWPMAKHGQQHFGRELIRNPLIWGTTAGLLANIAGFTVPDWMAPSVTRVGQAGLVLGLMAAGAGMQLSALPRAKVLAASMLSVRHFAMPVVAFIMAKMWGLDSTQTTTLLLFSALPTASTCYVLAARMGYNGPYVSSLVTASTAMAVLSLSFALSFLANAI